MPVPGPRTPTQAGACGRGPGNGQVSALPPTPGPASIFPGGLPAHPMHLASRWGPTGLAISAGLPSIQYPLPESGHPIFLRISSFFKHDPTSWHTPQLEPLPRANSALFRDGHVVHDRLVRTMTSADY